MKLIITIDTEGDNWSEYKETKFSLENIEKILPLQDLFDNFDAKPTYLITYPVATNDRAISILTKILKEGRCEIGSHCHPWSTPPFDEEKTVQNSMLCNLPCELQYRKLSSLHNAIIKNFEITPVSFRAGRWGYNKNVALNLCRLGYKIDTSITPYVDWKYCYGPDFSDTSPKAFRSYYENNFTGSDNNSLIEIPVTIGFLQQDFTFCNYILKTIKRTFLVKLKTGGILSKLHIVNKIWLTPEAYDSKDMIKLTKVMMKRGCDFINMTFHSPSLKAGLTPFVRTTEDEKKFFRRIKEFLTFTRDNGIESIRLSDILKPGIIDV